MALAVFVFTTAPSKRNFQSSPWRTYHTCAWVHNLHMSAAPSSRPLPFIITSLFFLWHAVLRESVKTQWPDSCLPKKYRAKCSELREFSLTNNQRLFRMIEIRCILFYFLEVDTIRRLESSSKKNPQLKPDARYPMYKYISSGVNFDDGPLPII